jgi:putative membrane protein
LLLTVAPLLLVAGLDRRVTLPLTRTAAASALRTGVGRRGLAVLASPVAATALWVAVALGGHLPAVSDAVLADGRLHAAQQIILIAAGVVFWTAVLGRLPSAHRVTVGQQIGALGVAMAAGGLVAAPLAWSNAVVHPGADPWFGLSPVQDQQLAAVLMMALDMPVLLGALVWVVARWAQRQASPTVGPDAVAASVPDGA